MRMGTRSLLYGAHCFFLHPWFVAAAWYRLYGFPLDPRLWIAFVVHDWGYWGKEKLDDERGEEHVELGASLMAELFGAEWGAFCLFHSRAYSTRYGVTPSRLCYADKLSTALTPWWLYVPMVRLTGEYREYMSTAKHKEDHGTWEGGSFEEVRAWFLSLQTFLKGWVARNTPLPDRRTGKPTVTAHYQSPEGPRSQGDQDSHDSIHGNRNSGHRRDLPGSVFRDRDQG